VNLLTLKAGTGDIYSVGDLIEAIELNLPSTLPSFERLRDKEEKNKKSEYDILLKYIQVIISREKKKCHF
jgi:hypothetical protein